jgi:polar amino acid transport system ATP-binding protein
MTQQERAMQLEDTAPAEGTVRVRGVSKSFGALRVLASLDLDVPAGQKLALIGPSGSGKSTVLRLIVGLEDPDAGQILLGGRTAFDAASRPRRRPGRPGEIGMVFQHFNLFPHMTALDNVSFAPQRVLGLTRAEAEARARELLARVGLEDKLATKPARLSGGQKQRVAIARALAMQPRILLFDEITSALDPETVGEVLVVLRDLAQSTDMTMLLVTHQMGFAREFADQIAFLDGGELVEQGPPEEIFSQPASARLRSFLRALHD